jgi:hypothetical protein
MKNKFYLFIALVGLLQVLSCKKDSQHQSQKQVRSFETGLLNFSVNGQLIAADIDTTSNIITFTIPRTLNVHNLTANFSLASQAIATINNNPVNSGTVVDFSKPVILTVESVDKSRLTSFHVNAQTDLQYFGLDGNILTEKSLNKDYEFYFDQFDGSAFQGINCGPTVTTMAIKWADSTFTKKPVDARNQIRSTGGWWYTGDIQTYLNWDGINSKIDTLSNIDSLVKKNIDNNNLLILCLDMFYVPQDILDYQHIQKFYTTDAPSWGHFLLVKGYKQTDVNFYLEIYDPYSDHDTYSVITTNQLKGKDRYYTSFGLKKATDIWWPYTIVVAPKGQQVIASGKLTINSIHKPIPQASGR